MRSYTTPLVVLVLVSLTLFSGYVQGRMRNRWGTPTDMQAAGKSLAAVPATFGPWKLEKPNPLGDNVISTLECAGYVSGVYVQQETGESVTAFVIVGPPGPIAAHTPDICFSSQAYTMTGTREQAVVPNAAGADAAFWTVTFRSNDVQGNLLKTYYAWNDGSAWAAPANPRWIFGGRPLLYKIQIAAPQPDRATPDANDVGTRFLQDFLPVLDRQLVKSQAESGSR